MNLIPWRRKRKHREGPTGPEAALARLRAEIDELFERFLGEPWSAGLLDSLPMRLGPGPRIDLIESDDEVTIKADLPGVEPEDLQIGLEGTMLVLRGQKKQQIEHRQRDYRYKERLFGSFCRTIPLPASIDPDKVEATFRNGVLTVTVAKRPEAKPKRIAIQGSS